jgi:UDP-N-acetylmuramate dehydrogenase
MTTQSAIATSGPANEVVSRRAVAFRATAGVSADDIARLLARRKATQPIGEWSCGSVFTNPPAITLRDSSTPPDFMGARSGGACVSEMHANFIVNDGTASAADIEHLIRRVQQTVEQVHGVKLQTEVRIVGEVK